MPAIASAGEEMTPPATRAVRRGREWLQRVGVRPRILGWYVVLLSVAIAITLAVERNAIIGALEQRIQEELLQEVQEVRRLVGGPDPAGDCVLGTDPDGACELGSDPATGEPFADVQAVFDTFLRTSIPGRYETMATFVDGEFYASSIDQPLVDLQEVPAFVNAVASADQQLEGRIETPAGDVWFLAEPVAVEAAAGQPRGVFAVAQFMAPQLAEVYAGARISIIANLVVLGVASVLAYLATSRLLRPIRLVTETANMISESDLSQRIEVRGNDEVSRLAGTFNAMLDRLEHAFAAQRRFLDDAGHELRTPITIVRGNLETLPEGAVQRERALAIARDELARMSRMVNDLLTLAKAGRPDFLELGEVDLGSLLVDLHEKSEAIAPRDWALRLNARGCFVADAQRLTQAMLQLAENAVAHTQPGERIELGGTLTPTGVVLWVADSGEGIPDEEREHLFDRFHRGSARRGDGAGLGLSIVSAIADAHGGSVTVDSEVGVGTRFCLHLPLTGNGVFPVESTMPAER